MVINLSRYRGILICIVILFGLGCMVAVRSACHKRPDQIPSLPNVNTTDHGLYIKWSEVNGLFPRYAKATITDFESGKSFKVQRRGGSSHADVQPLTAGDTAVMKEIYHGNWSWKRRSVIVTLERGSRIAASMAGMPHGQGAIRGNRFNGHFCLHFRDSKTHGSGKVDPAHQMMIWKSAGIEETQLMTMPSGTLVETFFTAVDQGDKDMACRLVSKAAMPFLAEDMDSIKSVSISSIKEYSFQDYKVDLRVQYEEGRYPVSRQGNVLLLPTAGGWFIDYSSVRPWLVPPGT
ncbi:MAG: hypothetical protein ACM3PE_00505 [Deltaproteobacteria bacterium]